MNRIHSIKYQQIENSFNENGQSLRLKGSRKEKRLRINKRSIQYGTTRWADNLVKPLPIVPSEGLWGRSMSSCGSPTSDMMTMMKRILLMSYFWHTTEIYQS